MKGLLLKDFYCMKHNLVSFLCLTFGVVVIGVMFAVSIHHGNMADLVDAVVAEDGMPPESVYDMFRFGVWLVLLIPMAYVANVIDCFKADRAANCGKQLFTMPLKTTQIVGARYLACLLYAGLSFVGSFFAAVCVSLATDQYPLWELTSVAATFGAVLMVYLCIVMMLIYLFGTRYADAIQALPFLAALIACVILVQVKLKSMTVEQEDALMADFLGKITEFLTQHVGMFCVIALIMLVLSFFASVKIVEKRRAKAIC